MAVAAVGEGVMALGGDKISKEQRLELETLSGSRFYLLFDADEAGKEASRRCAEDLYPKALACPPEYGEGSKDVADLYRERGDEAREV